MIRVHFGTLSLIYVGLMLGPIISAWLLNEYRRSRRERDAFQHVLRCKICAFEFEDPAETPLAHCPRCGSANERSPVSKP